MDYKNRIIRIFILSIVTSLIPFIILSHMWGVNYSVPARVVVVIFVVNTLPCIIINFLYHKHYSIREWLSSFYFFVSFFLSFAIIMIIGIKFLYGNYFDYLIGFIILFMLAESMSVFFYITYIFIKYVKEIYVFSMYEKIIYFMTGIFFALFIILFSAFTSAVVIYLLD